MYEEDFIEHIIYEFGPEPDKEDGPDKISRLPEELVEPLQEFGKSSIGGLARRAGILRAAPDVPGIASRCEEELAVWALFLFNLFDCHSVYQ